MLLYYNITTQGCYHYPASTDSHLAGHPGGHLGLDFLLPVEEGHFIAGVLVALDLGDAELDLF